MIISSNIIDYRKLSTDYRSNINDHKPHQENPKYVLNVTLIRLLFQTQIVH